MHMFGILLTILSIFAIAAGAYRIGASTCSPDVDNRDAYRNTSLVVIVLGFTSALCGMLSLMNGGGMPFDGFVKGGM